MKPQCNECCDTGTVTIEGREEPIEVQCECQCPELHPDPNPEYTSLRSSKGESDEAY
jgi:hypothetical protein